MKVLCVLLPHLPLKCEFKRHPDMQCRSAVVTYGEGSQKLVLDYSPELEGLQVDMPLQQALSRHGEVELFQADIPHYWFSFNEILDLLEEKSPLVEGSNLGTAYLGLDGLQLIYPDDNVLIQSILEVIPEPFTAQIGIGQGKFMAYLAALYSPPGNSRILPENVTAFLKDLPCHVLPVSTKSRNKLQDFGLRTLGQITKLSPGPLQSQFGPEGKRIWELAGGFDSTPLFPRLSEESIEEKTTLSSVTVSLEALLVTWESMLSRTFSMLSPRGMGIRGLMLWTLTWKSEYWMRPVKFKEPAMDVRSVISRLQQVLENYPQAGPVEQLGLKITGLGYQNGKQKSLFSEVRNRDRLLDDIKHLNMRLGNPQVFKIKEVEPWSRIPERRYVLAPLS